MATWPQVEKDAMAGDRAAILMIVSALRVYRSASKKLLASLPCQDTECGTIELLIRLNDFQGEIEEIER